MMKTLSRIVVIIFRSLQYLINREILGDHFPMLRGLSYLNPLSWRKPLPRGEAITRFLIKLGPIFVKFGQILSTRRDLLPEDVADELAKLQDKVPAFCSNKAKQLIESALGKSIEQCFSEFSHEPLAAASIAQVHAAKLLTGEDVVVKVLRPNILKTIQADIRLLYVLAKIFKWVYKGSEKYHAKELVQEFEYSTLNELDLMMEAANASQLKRNFADSAIMYVPAVFWDYTRENVMVQERIYGVPVGDLDTLKAHHVDLKKLSERGAEIFFTQVFRDKFFHADMHPGNIFVDITDPDNPKYNGVDFGIMGVLTDEDQQYLAQNFLAFFNRDYKKIAIEHVKAGWVPKDTPIGQFEMAIRAACEPYFNKPLKEISYGKFLMRLLKTAERFNMQVQPQLFLLQKTLLNVEGLGRQLYPDLDLWATAKPLLEQWIVKESGPCEWLAFVKQKLAPHAGKLFSMLSKFIDKA